MRRSAVKQLHLSIRGPITCSKPRPSFAEQSVTWPQFLSYGSVSALQLGSKYNAPDAPSLDTVARAHLFFFVFDSIKFHFKL